MRTQLENLATENLATAREWLKNGRETASPESAVHALFMFGKYLADAVEVRQENEQPRTDDLQKAYERGYERGLDAARIAIADARHEGVITRSELLNLINQSLHHRRP